MIFIFISESVNTDNDYITIYTHTTGTSMSGGRRGVSCRDQCLHFQRVYDKVEDDYDISEAKRSIRHFCASLMIIGQSYNNT